MLGSAVPATASTYTSPSSSTATPTNPTRPSRLRGLSYLRSYTHSHLRTDAPLLTRTASSPGNSPPPTSGDGASAWGIQNGESGWLPTVTSTTSTATAAAAPEPSGIMTRSRAATVTGPTPASSTRRQSSTANETPTPSGSMTATAAAPPSKDEMPTIRFIPHVETRSTRPSLHFTTMSRTLRTATSIVRVGRYSERDNNNAVSAATGTPSHHQPVGFKSKVVSRRHCEFWCGGPNNQQWYIKDVKSSSGTFLNHVRLSPPGQESRPYEVNDGDTVQLGIDFKGGEEVIFRCVKIRIECNRGWQKSLNAYNTTAHKRLLKNAGVLGPRKGGARDSDAASVNSSECSICLNPVAPCQALFVAPCSHVWHYKCVRNLIHGPSYPNFLCPNCRFVADLEADVEPLEEADFDEAEDEVDGPVAAEGDAVASGSARAGDGSGELQQQPGGSSRDDEDSDDRRTPRPRDHTSSSTDDELSHLLHKSSLHPPAPTAPERLSDSPHSTTQPLAIALPPTQRSSATSTDLPLAAHSATPTSTTQFALASGIVMADGPMTPRNDAGPFVLDGSAGRRGLVMGGLEGVVGEDGEGRR
ncbi:hypothetical protein LTR53_012771 [Teratosphaeriaceae sp. CCFEE 6253]|nr:hypothetical protein LTR53_012771 [Teratosphaeriaceae sp. CCFEE 6253]